MKASIKKTILILVLAFVHVTVHAQNDLLLSLNRRPWKCNNKILDSILKKYPDTDSVYFRVPVTVWVYPNKKGFGPGFNEIKKFILSLNYYFNKANHIGVEFYLAQVKIMPTNRHQSVGYAFENSFLTLINHTRGTLNIHLVNKIDENWILWHKEFGGIYNSLTHSIIITRSDLPTGLAHEVGHYFGLLHPHRNWNKGEKRAEAVSRTMTVDKQGHRNCECRGDYLCDTPAEPDLSFFMDDSCHYIGTVTDPWGEPYKPLTDNIMSYQPNKKCRKHFTRYQRAVILLSLENSRFYKFWKTSKQNISFTPDKYEPDDYIQIPTLLLPFRSQYHTFHLVYTAKSLRENTSDFFKFYPHPGTTLYLSLTKAKHTFPPVRISMYDNFYNLIFSREIQSPSVIKLPTVSSPVCYIKLQSLSPLAFGELFDYNVELQQF